MINYQARNMELEKDLQVNLQRELDKLETEHQKLLTNYSKDELDWQHTLSQDLVPLDTEEDNQESTKTIEKPEE